MVPEEEEEEALRKLKKETDGENTLEKNLNNLNVNKYDVEFDLDPLFHKTSAKFDEGGSKGLLLNNIAVKLVFYKERLLYYSRLTRILISCSIQVASW